MANLAAGGWLPLDTMLVVDLGSSIATAYTGRLLADAGATVVRVEPATGSPLRRRPEQRAGGDAALFRYLDAGKRSVVGDPSALLAAADVILSDDGGAQELSDRLPGAIVVSYTPFGLDGPDVARPASPLVVQALSGSIGGRGDPAGMPMQAGGDLAEWIGAVAAASTVLLAWRAGAGTLLDLSELETAVTIFNGFQTVAGELTGTPSPTPARVVEVPSVERASDGWVGFCTLSAEQFGAFAEMIGQPAWAEDADISRIDWRARNGHQLQPEIEAWTSARTVVEIMEVAAAARVPCTPVGNGETLTQLEQVRSRGCLTRGDDGLLQPRPAARFSALATGRRAPAPNIGRDDATEVLAEHRAHRRPEPRGTWPLPLQGIRVFDMTSFWAGPAASQFLGAFGAEVLKVESLARPDGTRLATSYGVSGDRVWERAPLYLGCNTSKRGLTLDLTRPEGARLAKKIIASCDILVENYTPRVAERFGLLDDVPDELIVLRMPAWGLEGPWRDRPGFAQTMEQVTGLAWRTGDPDAPPLVPRGPCDPNGAFHAAFAAVLALLHRDRTGRGQVVESALLDAALAIAGEQVVEYAASGTLLERTGNRDPRFAPQGVYAADGQERWVALTVRDDDEWRTLLGLLGREDLLDDRELATMEGRQRRHDELDALLSAWLRGRDAVAAVNELVAVGIPAAVVVAPREVGGDAQLAARGYFELVNHPVAGSVHLPGFPGRIGGRSIPFHRTPAPLLGGDGREILRELAGVDDAEYERLESLGIVGTDFPAPHG